MAKLDLIIKTMKAVIICFILISAGFFLAGIFANNTINAQDKGTAKEQVEAEKSDSAGLQDSAGIAFIAAAIATGLSSIAAGIAVSVVGSAALGAVAERPELMGRSLIYVGLAEGVAIYGLVVSILIIFKL